MKIPTPEDFIAVTAKIEAALKLADSKKDEIKNAVNWADLGIVDLRWTLEAVDVTFDSDGRWMATISEASPDAYEFRKFLTSELARQNVSADIFTEW